MTAGRARAAASLLTAFLGASCGGPAPAPTPAASSPPGAAAPALVAEPAAFDFGRVLPDRTLHKVFRLRNLGRDPVAIESITSDCGCMVVGDYARQLAPGASTALTLQLNTPAQPGTLARSLIVKTGGAQPGQLELRVRATVVGG